MIVCTCGDPSDHEIAHRQLETGERICFWSDGSVTWGDVGRTMLRGIGRARYQYRRAADLRANEAIMDLAGFLSADEIVPAIQAARAFVRAGGTYDDYGRRIREAVLRAVSP